MKNKIFLKGFENFLIGLKIFKHFEQIWRGEKKKEEEKKVRKNSLLVKKKHIRIKNKE